MEGRAEDEPSWDGTVDITVTPAKPTDFIFYLRVPGWSDSTQVTLNGQPVSGVTRGQYLRLAAPLVVRRHYRCEVSA
jgi:DUF1680 family protein